MMEDRPERIDPRIAPADVDEIRVILGTLPKVNQRIMSMQLEPNEIVRVRTGIIVAPLAGHGNIVTFQREADGWRVVHIGGWIS